MCFKSLHDYNRLRNRHNFDVTLASNLAPSAAAAVVKPSAAADNAAKQQEQNDLLSFVRVYNGELTQGATLYNAAHDCREHCEKIFLPSANLMKQVPKLTAGQIGVVSGLRRTTTGDLLVSSKHAFAKAAQLVQQQEREDIVHAMHKSGVDVAQPVYFCTVEAASEPEERRLRFALECLEREDPSFRVALREGDGGEEGAVISSGQIIVQGMGELHIDVIKQRLQREFKLKCYFGPLSIAYKECPTVSSVTAQKTLERTLTAATGGGGKIRVDISLTLKSSEKKFESVSCANEELLTLLSPVHLRAMNNGIRSALNSGVLMRFPVVNVEVWLESFSASAATTAPFVSSATFQCAREALRKAECVIMQPVMQVDIVTSKEYASRVNSDLVRRAANEIRIETTDNNAHVTALVPLAHLGSYSSDLRKIASGNASFTIEFNSYEPISDKEYKELQVKKSY